MAEREDRYEVLRYEIDESIATITLDRPDALNALDLALKRELLAALRRAGHDPAVRVLVLTGSGRAFCAGQDLHERLEPGAAPLDAEVRERYNPLILALRTIEKPIIAAVNGVAAGAGASLAFACDIRIASERASFILAFGRVGLIPDSGATWLLPRLIGPGRAAELAFTTDPLAADDAARYGLVSHVVADTRLLDEARGLARRLATAAPLALALTKRALNRSLEVGLAEALDYEASLQGIAGRTADHAEGVAAFVEKRSPRFSGG
ncbi:MAG TPA: enoyl-CoA hydratase-related protein [Candidatus Limnocylindrales bacterium]